MADSDYQRLLGFRTELRRFVRWSEKQARAEGLSPSQHQLLLAVKGHLGKDWPTIGEIARYLVLRHHSAVELVDRAEQAGLVKRCRDREDHRVVRLRLTTRGEGLVRRLSEAHLQELARIRSFALPKSG